MAPQQPPFPNDPIAIFFPNGSVEGVQIFVWQGGKPVLWDGSISVSTTGGPIKDGVDNTILATVLALANSHPLTVAVVDSNGDQVGSFGGGTQYTDGGAPPTHPIGNALVFNSGSAWQYVRSTAGLPVDIKASVAIAITAASLPLPTGAATETTLNDCETDLDTLVTSNAAIQTDTDLLAATFTPYFYISSGASNQDSQVVKNAAGRVGYISVFSTVAAARYVKLYDKATGPTSSDTPVYVAAIPNNTTGAGSNLAIPPGIKFTSGISHRITSGFANNDTGAASTGDVLVNIGYV